MKSFRIYIIFLLTFIFFAGFSTTQAAKNCTITTLLHLGSKSDEVNCLQQSLGLSPDGKFGPKTRAAVVSWQTKNGLYADGVFGFKSRSFWNTLAIVVLPKSTEDKTKSIVSTTKVQSNMVNLEKFINTVVDADRKLGVSEADLKTIATTLRQIVESSDIDYLKEFNKEIINENKARVSILGKIINKSLTFLGLEPSVAEAIGTSSPFGGKLIFPMYCNVSSNWMLTFIPLPPTYAALLSYTTGTQAFSGYNLPFTTNVLGHYTPGSGMCVVGACPYCVTIPTEGTITPQTGSSSI